MSIYLSDLFLINRAPFESLRLEFGQNEIAILSGVNGRGKTTIMSYIVDSIHEFAKLGFELEYEGKAQKYYRIFTPSDRLDPSKFSLVYLRFRNNDGETFDYANMLGSLDSSEYDLTIPLEEKIPYSSFQGESVLGSPVKRVSASSTKEKIQKIFSENLMCYFPSYRYEAPSYLNDIYKIEIDFAKKDRFSGFLLNPIEVVTGLPQLINWIMDVLLDLNINKDENFSKNISQNLNLILSKILISKNFGDVRFGIGFRNNGGGRLQVVKDTYEIISSYSATPPSKHIIKQIYPSIFNISSGEAALLIIFGELLRHIDNLSVRSTLNDVTGLVLIDEVDKHLHIRLQKEILPILFGLFPNVQFILSSHSPFLSIGLAETQALRTQIIDLDNSGRSCDPVSNEMYREVYEMMISQNSRFKDLYDSLSAKILATSHPLIITEGKTDWKYFLRALKYFHGKNEYLEVEDKFFLRFGSCSEKDLAICGTVIDFDMSGPQLQAHLKELIQTRKKEFNQNFPKRIGIFDSDDNGIKLYGDDVLNVFSFKISPDDISTELLFDENEIKTEFDGKRLFLGSEFDRNSKFCHSDSNLHIAGESSNSNKAGRSVIVDESVFDARTRHNVALSKSKFSELIFNDDIKISPESWEKFRFIFDELMRILVI